MAASGLALRNAVVAVVTTVMTMVISVALLLCGLGRAFEVCGYTRPVPSGTGRVGVSWGWERVR